MYISCLQYLLGEIWGIGLSWTRWCSKVRKEPLSSVNKETQPTQMVTCNTPTATHIMSIWGDGVLALVNSKIRTWSAACRRSSTLPKYCRHRRIYVPAWAASQISTILEIKEALHISSWNQSELTNKHKLGLLRKHWITLVLRGTKTTCWVKYIDV